MLPFVATIALALAYRPIIDQKSTLSIHSTAIPKAADESSQQQPCNQKLGCAGCTCGLAAGKSRTASIKMVATDADAQIAAAAAAAAAAATAAERFAIKGGNGGDLFGRDGIEPTIAAALDACGEDAVRAELERAARAAAGRTNANAARVADAIIVAAKGFGARARADNLHDITGQARYATMYDFTRSDCKWKPDAK